MTCERNNSSEIPCTMLLLYKYFFTELQPSFMLSYLVNLMTPQNLPALYCNFTRMFFTWNSWNTSKFLNFQTSPASGCMLNMITP